MRVLHVNHSDRSGGAAIAARRLVLAQREAGIDAQMLVVQRSGDEDWVLEAPMRARITARLARAFVKRLAGARAGHDRSAMRTLAAVSTGLGQAIRGIAPDIVHWHWTGSEGISLQEMAAIELPAVWTCHDEWAWCGAEHYAADDRFASGYPSDDFDGACFARKQRDWADFSPVLIGPSAWIADRAASSMLFGHARREVIANTLDTHIFAPCDKQAARQALGLPKDRKIVLFGAQGGAADPRKGFDLLAQALATIPPSSALQLISFGGAEAGEYSIGEFPAREMGKVSRESDLAQLYNAADLFVAPSRMDNLPNTMLESLACGTPCAGFAIGGLPDLVRSEMEGELVPAFDCAGLGAALLRLAPRDDSQRQAIRENFLERFAPSLIADRHLALYRQLLGESSS